jgi:hypothetical protein
MARQRRRAGAYELADLRSRPPRSGRSIGRWARANLAAYPADLPAGDPPPAAAPRPANVPSKDATTPPNTYRTIAVDREISVVLIALDGVSQEYTNKLMIEKGPAMRATQEKVLGKQLGGLLQNSFR